MDLNELKALRIRNGLKQRDLAELLCINTNSYTKKENETNPFTISEIKSLKEFFNMDDELFLRIFF